MSVHDKCKNLIITHYFIREQFYGSALRQATVQGESTTDEDHQLEVVKAVCYILLGKSADAFRVLNQIKVASPCVLGVQYALLAAHALATAPDRTSMSEIERQIQEEAPKAMDVSLISGAEVLYLTGQFTKAKALVEKLVKEQQTYDPSRRSGRLFCLMGWIELQIGKDHRSALELFNIALEQGYSGGYIGRSRYYEIRHDEGEMRSNAMEMKRGYADFLLSHLEYARAMMVARDWENVRESMMDVTRVYPNEHPLIHYWFALYAICAGNNVDSELAYLAITLDEFESSNQQLLHYIAALFIRCSAKNKAVLQFAKTQLAKAMSIAKKDSLLVEELRLAMAVDDTKQVMTISRELIELTVDHPFALLGITVGFAMSNRVKDAKEQYEMLITTHPNITSHSIYYFVGAVLDRQQGKPFEEFRKKIEDGLVVHRANVQNFSFGTDYLMTFDVELLFSIALQIMEFAPHLPVKSPNEPLKLAESILLMILENCPGLSQVSYQLAQVYYLKSEPDQADKMLQICLKKNDAVAEAYLLRAQIFAERGQVEEADKCLNTGLNFNFSVRESSLYHLVKAKVHKRANEFEKAADSLRNGLKMPAKLESGNILSKKNTIEAHRISLQLELIDCLQSMKRNYEAETAMDAALQEWQGKPEEEQLMLLHSQLLVRKGDVDGALNILNKVKPDQPNYQSARIKMAEIYLEEKKDKRMFAVCYRELMSVTKTAHNITLLGDAYLSIQEPEKAIEFYESAMKMSSYRDLALTEKIGEAYVMCHLYSKAVNFYESAMNATKSKRMRQKLADLLLKLGNLEKCERILRQPLDEEKDPSDPEIIASHVQYLQLLSKLHLENQRLSLAIDDLQQAKELQEKMTLKGDSPSTIAAKKELAKICCLIGDLYLNLRQTSDALNQYTEAYNYDVSNIKIMLSIASVYLMMGKYDKCSEQCRMVTQIDRQNDQATLMQADLHFIQNHIDQSALNFSNVLEKYPNNYHALSRYIELCWRTGNVEAAEAGLKRAMEHNPRCSVESGFNFCKGLQEWYSGEINLALQAFNRARKDPAWTEKSICNMIEIILNPDNEILGDASDREEEVIDEEFGVGTMTAERFLKESRLKGTDPQYVLMENFINVNSKDRNKVSQALQNLLQMVGPETGPVMSVGAVLGAARAYNYLKQQQKAKQVLKRVMNHKWSLEDADYLEKCWLALVEIYTDTGKNDQAMNIINEILQRNQSCIRAIEKKGVIWEKEQKFEDAAGAYQIAYELTKKKNPQYGYKLAYNYMKSKQYFKSLEVCETILQHYPSYPRIRKEIMEKVRMQIYA